MPTHVYLTDYGAAQLRLLFRSSIAHFADGHQGNFSSLLQQVAIRKREQFAKPVTWDLNRVWRCVHLREPRGNTTLRYRDLYCWAEFLPFTMPELEEIAAGKKIIASPQELAAIAAGTKMITASRFQFPSLEEVGVELKKKQQLPLPLPDFSTGLPPVILVYPQLQWRT